MAASNGGTYLRALREVYWLLREGRSEDAQLALDAFLIRQDVNPEDYAGLNVLAPRQVPTRSDSNDGI